MPDNAQYFPQMIVPTGHVEPVARRIRAFLAGRTLFDTVRAVYVWEWPGYPQYCVPAEDFTEGVLVDEDHTQKLSLGVARRHGLRIGEAARPGSARLWTEEVPPGLAGTVRIDWAAPDAWFEEDEQVFVHPRSPYTRVDALRSSRTVRVELDGEVLAEAPSTVMVFETGLPTRYYLDRLHTDLTRLVPSDTVTACPYKGTTSAYWSATTKAGSHADIAWSYDFPTRQLAPIAGLVAFYNEQADIFLDGRALPRPAPVKRTAARRPA
ncbi:DUF427 domain-containing protein [Streptomyces niveus]|uniref:DUF427 domain-containing protein n=1 Tax=Streptomyces niveus TaxID=193462 RepID=A0A1U9R1V5_STRNV|nr:DUF427 domain-containing protein [Streptomyces niveus]AQU70494.1 hypothetical protein BBN63_34365 [Streptomyces niveus]